MKGVTNMKLLALDEVCSLHYANAQVRKPKCPLRSKREQGLFPSTQTPRATHRGRAVCVLFFFNFAPFASRRGAAPCAGRRTAVPRPSNRVVLRGHRAGRRRVQYAHTARRWRRSSCGELPATDSHRARDHAMEARRRSQTLVPPPG